MIEDKLTREERIRLECLSLAIARGGGFATEVINQAAQFESFIERGKQ